MTEFQIPNDDLQKNIKHTTQFTTFASELFMARRPSISGDESLPDTRDELTDKESEIVKKAPDCLELIGYGLARIVFEHEQTDTVLKIARIGNHPVSDGMKQNQSEVDTFQECGDEFSMVPITDYDEDFLWVQMKKVPLLTETVDEERAEEVEIALSYHFTECPAVDIQEVSDENIGVYDDKGALIDYGGHVPEPTTVDLDRLSPS
jgi:hypothetical protein